MDISAVISLIGLALTVRISAVTSAPLCFVKYVFCAGGIRRCGRVGVVECVMLS